MMTKMFGPQLGKNIEIYIDDMVVKSKVESDHVNDLGNIFDILKKVQAAAQRLQVFFWCWIREVIGLYCHAPWD